MKFRSCIISVMLISIWGCSNANDNFITLDASGKHPAGWAAATSGGMHPAVYRANQGACVECHGSSQDPNASGGISSVSCFSASRNGIACHPDGPSGHPAGWSAAVSHGAAAKASAPGLGYCTQCHGTAFTGGVGKSCMTCHTTAPHPAAPWRGTTASGTNHATTDQGNAAECSRCHAGGAKLSTPVAPLANASCFNNTLCHGTAVGHPAGWSAAASHGASAKAAPGASLGFEYCTQCHGSDFVSGNGTSCKTCHTAAPHPAAPWRGTTTTGTTHTTTDQGNAGQCALCHLNNQRLATPVIVPVGTTLGCFNNTLCHAAISAHSFPNPGSAHKSSATGCGSCHASGSATSAYPVAAGTAPDCLACHIGGFKVASGTSSCWECHGSSATDGRPNGSSFPNRQVKHNKSEHKVACTVCHPFTAGDSRHGWSNGVRSSSAQVGGTATSIKSWNPATKSCQPTCHGTETWK